MATPSHYSREIAERCQSLIEHLLPCVQGGLPDDERFGGSLDTTFLVAMATPMILLPVERIFQSKRVADEKEYDPVLAEKFREFLGNGQRFGVAPFVRDNANDWRYVSDYPQFNIADAWPCDLIEKLSSEEATQRAREESASRIILHLRNALAHGGIAYLNKNGNPSEIGSRVAMLAFAAFNCNRDCLNILCIDQDAFANFLIDWANWINQEPFFEQMADSVT